MAGDLSVFTHDLPRREWLVRCQDSNLDLAVCSIEANDGKVEIISPEGTPFTLTEREIADFYAALDAAVAQAADDLTTP
jgi:hypothetical protein